MDLQHVTVGPRFRDILTNLRYSSWQAVLCGLYFTLLTTFLRLWLTRLLQVDIPIILFLIGVVASSLVGGMLSGSVAVLSSFLVMVYYFTAPPLSWEMTNRAEILQVFLFIAESTALVFIIENMHVARANEIARTSKLKAREQELEAAHQKIMTILESISDAFFAVDKQWRFTYVNSRAEQMFQLKKDALLGQVIWAVLPSLVGTKLEKNYRLAREQRQAIHFEAYVKPMLCWYEVHVYPSKDGLSVYFDDISKRKQLERQKDEFLGIVSHELKTPVTSVKVMAQYLWRKFTKSGDTTTAEALHKIDEQTNRMNEFINDILDRSRLQSGKLTFSKELFHFDDLVAKTVNTIQATITTHTIRILSTSGAKVRSDPQRIEQVITNLITNAIKYSPESDVVDISMEVKNNQVWLTVTDYGVGIPYEQQHQLFSRYYRTEKTKAIPGIGLGLYISAEIVHQLGGTIGFNSKEGQGTSFFFSLPYQ